MSKLIKAGDFVYCNIDSDDPLLGTVVEVDSHAQKVKVRVQDSSTIVWCDFYEIDKLIQEVS